MRYPKRIYTVDEVEKARALTKQGWKHRLRIKGSADFKQKAQEALKLVKTADYYDFLRTYIRSIEGIEGFTQLREAEASIWVDKETLADSVDAAGVFIQKAQQMKDFLEDKPYYGGQGEISAVNKRLEFLDALENRTKKQSVKKRCEEILKSYADSILP